MIEFHCPTCGRCFKVPDDRAGKMARCSACQETVRVPVSPPADPEEFADVLAPLAAGQDIEDEDIDEEEEEVPRPRQRRNRPDDKDDTERAGPSRPKAPAGQLAILIVLASLVGAHLLLDLVRTITGNRVRWEYKVDSVPDVLFKEEMDKLGQDGWELVFARRAQGRISSEFSYEVIFKRKK